ncbi:DUF2871 domain-containing protein [Candidatus Enterococcus courvalinii]|uniref:DUF2871 domain-containing protein n=1 Tax=Candidatus Enterococcus courvalinii TaxID=2815329 RepID=A0ABS3I110_9ENTE|nr:DUF2871 domain-containing protein [Enterococcus sp. MSG2901]MBO0482404.1 DUF2871 domain-containing protein [Enterococcus sp. MSG2901]
MKKVMNTAIVYFVLAMSSGVFYREITKLNDFMGQTVLAVVHTHLFALGTGLFLLMAVLFKLTHLEENKLYKKFYLLYNISFPLMIVMMVVRGMIQVQQRAISTSMDAMISGIAGLSHIGVAVALLMVLLAIKKEMLNEM